MQPGLNPLQNYPNRGWETVYRDLYTPDSQFHYLCAPDDTHGYLLKANVKNGVVTCADPSFGYGNATDMYANAASSRWDPPICISGISSARRFYSHRRVKAPMVRRGFKDWVDAGFPRDPETDQAERRYFEARRTVPPAQPGLRPGDGRGHGARSLTDNQGPWRHAAFGQHQADPQCGE